MEGAQANAGGSELRTVHFVLLDRDGVINVDLPTSVRSMEEMRIIEGVPQAIAAINSKGYSVLVVTNQAVVARGDLSRTELDRIHSRIEETIEKAGGRIYGWYVCDHDDAKDCDCRKPRPGLILKAASDHGFEVADTWFVGDAERDVQAALAAGCLPVLVRTGKGARTAEKMPEVPAYESLIEFADHLVDMRENLSP